MNITEINGSPRINGNTNSILNLCEKNLNSLQTSSTIKNEYNKINLSKYNLQWCKGCRLCFDISEVNCPNKDSLLPIKEILDKADCIIIGSPVYVEDISGIMKNFLDRMAFNCHRPFLKGKPIYIYTTSASIASKHASNTLKRAFISWGGNIIGTDNFIIKNNTDLSKVEKILEKRMKILVKMCKSKDVSLYNLISFGIQKRYWGKRKGTADYNYWKNMNWLNTECIYYGDIKVNVVKKYITTFIVSIVGKFIR